MDGAEVLARLRQWSKVPVIIFSVRNTEEEIVRLLDTGELVARMKVAIRRRAPMEAEEVFVSGRLTVDLQNREVRVSDTTPKLTPTEYALLRLLVQHAGRILTHRQIFREVWGPNVDEETNYLRVYITGLRKKIEANPQMPELIVTEPGVGYRLKIIPPA
jgi:two-component system KDP operon response regulator KdpE